VRSDCNSCNGHYSQSGTSLSINNVACTLVFCSLASLDGNYASALEHVQSAVVNGSALIVTGSGFTLRFRS
jgi:heat shock protein HslJ